jgi:hypothetical protein
MQNANMWALDKKELTDAGALTLDKNIPYERRAQWFFENFKNPYCFRLGDMAVKIEFAENAPTMQDVMAAYLLRQKSGG